MHHAIVKEPFGNHAVGDRITDADEIKAAREAGHGPKLLRVHPPHDWEPPPVSELPPDQVAAELGGDAEHHHEGEASA